VLLGIDETKNGPDRLTGVGAGERDRLISLCWSQLVPPFAQPGKFVFAVLVESDYARRPVMLTQGNKVLVRLEDKNVAPDWYRLRDLFTEQPARGRTGRPPGLGSMHMPGTGEPAADLCIRGRLWLGGARGRSQHITETARLAVLALLNANDAPVAGPSSAVGALMDSWTGQSWHAQKWKLKGPSSTQVINARWHGLAPGGQAITEARLAIGVIPDPAQGDSLTVQVDILLTNPRRASQGDKAAEVFEDPGQTGALAVLPPEVFVDLGTIGRLMLSILAALWGRSGKRPVRRSSASRLARPHSSRWPSQLSKRANLPAFPSAHTRTPAPPGSSPAIPRALTPNSAPSSRIAACSTPPARSR
jgi:hypothetical protein